MEKNILEKFKSNPVGDPIQDPFYELEYTESEESTESEPIELRNARKYLELVKTFEVSAEG